MELDLRSLSAPECYKVLTGAVTPRPIAWVTTVADDGVRNAAPYSFFNVMGHEPPTVALGLLGREGRLKDTAANILSTGEFVVNLVAEADAGAMNQTCVDAPAGVDEIELVGLRVEPSTVVAPPRIASSPVSFECRTLHALRTSESQTVVIGEVLVAHVADAFILDRSRLHLDTPAMGVIDRMHGAGWYARPTDLFQLDRPAWPPR